MLDRKNRLRFAPESTWGIHVDVQREQNPPWHCDKQSPRHFINPVKCLPLRWFTALLCLRPTDIKSMYYRRVQPGDDVFHLVNVFLSQLTLPSSPQLHSPVLPFPRKTFLQWTLHQTFLQRRPSPQQTGTPRSGSTRDWTTNLSPSTAPSLQPLWLVLWRSSSSRGKKNL